METRHHLRADKLARWNIRRICRNANCRSHLAPDVANLEDRFQTEGRDFHMEKGTQHEKFEGERTLMRIHIGESDRWHGKPLYEAIIELLRREKFSGATVLRGVGGYGGSR